MYTHLNIGHEGRLGNQLFQFAMLHSVAIKNGTDFLLPRENCYNEINANFNPRKNIIEKQKLDLFNCFDLDLELLEPKSYIKSKIKNNFQEPPGAVRFYPEVFNQPPGTNFNGYYQSIHFFNDNLKELKNILTFKKDIVEFGDSIVKNLKNYNKNIVSLHIRRGDGLVPSIKGLFTTFQEFDYYHKIISEIHSEDNLYLIFSDDLEMCKEEFGLSENIIYFSDTSDNIDKQFLDFYVMSKSDFLIMPASTFSWWAAVLGEIKPENVYCPVKWWGVKLPNCSEEDLKIKNWNLR